MSDALFDQVKRKLNITWSDDDTDARINDIITSAEYAMRHKLGTPEDFDFAEVGQENMLFLSYCLYEWNHAANEFDGNYLNDILQIRQKYEVAAYEAENEYNGV